MEDKPNKNHALQIPTKNTDVVQPNILSKYVSLDMAHVLSQIRVIVPLLEMMRILEHKNIVLVTINDVGPSLLGATDDYVKQSKEKKIVSKYAKRWSVKIIEIYLGTTLHKFPSQVDPFFVTLMIKRKVCKKLYD